METSQERARRKTLRDNYNLTPEEWDRINEFQTGLCWICGKKQKSGKRLATDHSHKTGLIRGLLCSQCNRLLGKIERIWTLVMMLRAHTYLTSPPAVQALGREVFGYAGRCGTKKHRAELRKKAKAKAKQKRRKNSPLRNKLVPSLKH